jgi:ribonuclease HIII
MKTTDKNVVTILVDSKTMDSMKYFYLDEMVKHNQPFIEFIAKTDKITITGYKSLKVVFQGANAFKEAKIWNKNLYQDIKNISEGNYTLSHIGSDEVGTGDLFGPIIVVSCYVKADQIQLLKDLGVKDSKELDDITITKIAKKIIKIVEFSQLHLDNNKYNKLIYEGFNMNKIKAYLHNQALLNLTTKLKSKNTPIILDQFCPEDKYYSYLSNQKDIVSKIIFMTKAESKAIAVAAASIIARYSFISKLEKLGEKYATTLPKGAGQKVDNFAVELVARIGEKEFSSITKMNFKNLQRIIGLDRE